MVTNEDQIFNSCGCNDMNDVKQMEEGKNVPGLTSLRFRSGTHRSYKAAMLKELSAKPALEKLTSRTNDDLAISAIDAWATVLDVISFYQERIINEGYLRTATEFRSILELANHISYKPGPGVAAGTYLAFSLNEAKGSPAKTIIPKGTKVQSIPGQDELPQIFETAEEIEARVEWNAIKLRTKILHIPVSGEKEIYLKGILTGLKPGDGILMIGSERANTPENENWDFRRVKEVIPDPIMNHTRVTWEKGLGDSKYGTNPAAKDFKVFAFRQCASLFGYNAPDFKILPDTVKGQFLPSGLLGEYFNDINLEKLVKTITNSNIDFNWLSGSPIPGIINADNFSVRWSGLIQSPITGTITLITASDDGVRLRINNQPIIDYWPTKKTRGVRVNTGSIWLQEGQLYRIQLEYFERTGESVIKLAWEGEGLTHEIIPAKFFFMSGNYTDWPDYKISVVSGKPDTIHLDTIYPKIINGSWLILATTEYEEVYKVTESIESSRKGFTLTSKTMSLKLSGENLEKEFDDRIRDAVVFAQSEELEIADKPVTNSIINGNELILEKLVPGLTEGKAIIISGKRMRLKVTESMRNLGFSVPRNEIASRPLTTGDSLVILKKPEIIESDKANKIKWTLIDRGGFEGTIEGFNYEELLTSAEKDDVVVSEFHTIKSPKKNVDSTSIILNEPVTNWFDPATVEINANLAMSTHGETKEETLGSGNGSIAFQEFNLKQQPLTYVSAGNSIGAESTLQIRVNDILWKEVPSFFGLSPTDKVYKTTFNDEGIVKVQFGDGVNGSRLPTGTENIKAKYRIGTGSAGLLNAGQLSLLMTPQLGINKVINPVATSGSSDPETLGSTRKNAPLTVLTLDRIVSINDYEDFTRAFKGIGKARADILWNGEKQAVHLTIAAEKGEHVDNRSQMYLNLISAIKDFGQTNALVYINDYKGIFFGVSASILVDASFDFEAVKKKVIKSLVETFSFDSRDFGQDVTPAEVISVIQGVEGVTCVDLEFLNGTKPFKDPHYRLVSNFARLVEGNLVLAELLLINEDNITITKKLP
jgi:hypothetical protein